MLSKNTVVKARKAFESLYIGKVTITEYQKVQKATKITGFSEVVMFEGIPCRLSHTSTNNATQTDTASSISQVIKVFLAPEITIAPGSKLTVTQEGITTEYKSSGKPAVYSTHQEVVVELFKGWA